MPIEHFERLTNQGRDLTPTVPIEKLSQNGTIEAVSDTKEIIQRLDVIVNLLNEGVRSLNSVILYDKGLMTASDLNKILPRLLIGGDDNISLLTRTINSLQRLKDVCGSIQLGGTVEKSSLIEAIAHVSDNLVDLSQKYDISGQDLRDADHGQELTLKDIYPTASPKNCNC